MESALKQQSEIKAFVFKNNLIFLVLFGNLVGSLLNIIVSLVSEVETSLNLNLKHLFMSQKCILILFMKMRYHHS